MMRRISLLAGVLAAAILPPGCEGPPTEGPSAAPEAGEKAVAPAKANEAATSRPPSQAPIDAAQSVYTSLAAGRCRRIEQNIEEGGYMRDACPGAAGYRIELVESDLRQNILLIDPGGTRSQFNLPALIGSGGFSRIGETVEWRGPRGAAPRTLTIRYAVNEDPDPAVPPRSYLVVIRLGSSPCPVAVIPPGPQQSAQARRVADAPALPPCLEKA